MIFDNMIHVSNCWITTIDMTLRIRYFARMKNRSRDSLSNSFFSKILAPKLFKNWPLYSALQHTLSVKSRQVKSSQRVVCPLQSMQFVLRGPIQVRSSSSRFGEALSDFLDVFPFAIAKLIMQYFSQSSHSIKEILQRKLGLYKFSRMLVPHSLSECQKVDRMTKSIAILTILLREASNSLSCIVTDDKSWLLYQYPSDHIFGASRNEVIPREKWW
jgi:hypothetical protein